MRQQRDAHTTGESLSAWQQDTRMTANAEPQIDLDRVVWDPEYRDQVLETMREAG